MGWSIESFVVGVVIVVGVGVPVVGVVVVGVAAGDLKGTSV